MSVSPRITFRETDPTQTQAPRIYVLTTSTNKGASSSRLDEIVSTGNASSQQKTLDSTNRITYLPNFLAIYISTALSYLKILFLPTGYPHTVTSDYTPYQIYDSIQAFASTIASLLSSRAVLQSLNIISTSTSPSEADGSTLPSSSTEAATAATLLSILQSTLSNITTILFASRAAPRISSDVKFYRFLADVVNDLAFVLDLLAPSLPATFNIATYLFPAISPAFSVSLPLSITPRVLALCTSSMLRAICGVAGGSSKAVLSAHFARLNPENVGDLNAKDGSQETIINLMGMWVGGVVVSRVDGFATTWIWMLSLLAIHLWANYRAVRSVRLRGLNRERAGIVINEMTGQHHGWQTRIQVQQVGAKEGVLGIRKGLSRLWKTFGGKIQNSDEWRTWRVGVSVHEFIGAVCGGAGASTKISGALTFAHENKSLQSLLRVFEKDQYVPWVDSTSGRITIALKTGATPRDQLKACLVATMALKQLRTSSVDQTRVDTVTEIIETVKREVDEQWVELGRGLEKAGWDLDSVHLEDGTGCRFEIDDS